MPRPGHGELGMLLFSPHSAAPSRLCPFSLCLQLPSHFASCASVELGEGHSQSGSPTPYAKTTKRKAQTIHHFLRGGGLEPGSSFQDAGSFSLPQPKGLCYRPAHAAPWGLPETQHQHTPGRIRILIALYNYARFRGFRFPHHESHGAVFESPSPMGRDRHLKSLQRH
jgi:hypothetical protein